MFHCNSCGGELTRLRKGWLCEDCGERIPPDAFALEPSAEAADPRVLGEIIDRLPSLLAIPLADYAAEQNPVLKLWYACDVVELMLRFLVMVGVADLRRHGDLPDRVALLRLTVAGRPRLDVRDHMLAHG